MTLEKGIIASSQLTHLIIGFILGSALLIAFASRVTGRDTWIAVIIGCIVGIVFALTYVALAIKFSGMTLIEINDAIWGKYIGKLISVLYIWFFFTLASQNLRYIGDFLVTYLMPETPLVILTIIFVFICAWAVKEGIEVIARSSFILIIVTSAVILIVTLLLIKELKFGNLLPILDIPLIDLIQGSHVIAGIPFGETVVFLFIFAYVNKPEEIRKSVIKAMVFCGIWFLVVTIRNIAVLGPSGSLYVSASYQAARIIDIGVLFTRMEVLIAVALLSTVFLKITVFYYASVHGTATLLKLRTYKPLVIPYGIIIVSLSLIIYDYSPQSDFFGSNFFPIYALPYEFIIPLISLIIAKIRGISGKRSES